MKGKDLIVLCCVLVIAACAVPLGEDYVIRGGSEPAYILNYELQTYIPIPKAGNQPITLVNQGDLELSVIWKDEAGTAIPLPFDEFLPGTVYQAEIRITAQFGYAFYPSSSFAYPGGKIQTQSDDLGSPTRIIRVVYNNTNEADITYITDYDLQHYVPIPLAGDEPRVINREEVTVTAAWKKNGSSFTGNFVAGTVYQAEIHLDAKAGYLFRDRFDYPPGTGTGQTGQDTDPATRAFTVTYDKTRNPKVVNSLNLTSYIPKPAAGIMPVWSFVGPQYTGTVTWTITGTPAALTGSFQAGVEYTAEVTLSPAIGYTFTGAGQFVHGGALSLTNDPDSGAIQIRFPAAGAGGSTVVYDTDLIEHLIRPIEGLTPVRSIVAPQYTGTVTWTPAHRTFQADVVYTAELSLQAAGGYTFAGIGQNVFTHGDAQSVSNPAGSGTVRVVFKQAVSSVNPVIYFGPVGREDSALWLLHEKRDYIYSLAITLSPGLEDIFTGVTLVAGDNSPADVIINGQGRELTVKTAGALVTVGGGVTLTLQNITFEGLSGNTAPLFKVWPGGKLILGAGVTLRDNTTSSDAGGVWVNGGELVMNQGAVITGMAANRGGGVLIDAKGKFTMNDGTIAGSTVTGEEAGGGVLVVSGSFNMSGGNIRLNEASAKLSGGGVGVLSGIGTGATQDRGIFNQTGGVIRENTANGEHSGGGVFSYGLFNMNLNARIQDNHAHGVYSGGGVYIDGIDNGHLSIDHGTITGNRAHNEHSGGGVYIQKTAGSIMTNGIISGNYALAANSGGGMYVDSGYFTTGEYGYITGNTAREADSGGGVYLCWTATPPITTYVALTNGGFIKSNTAEKANSGGGVYISGAESVRFTNNNMIQENTAPANQTGGGVYMIGGTFTNANGGAIQDNQASYGGGVYITTGTFTNSGIIEGNQAPYGGGVYMTGGTFKNMEMIQGNTASANQSGGGVYLAGGTFESRGTIRANHASYDGNDSETGGGVYMTGGSFTNTELGYDGTIGGTSAADANTAQGASSANGIYIAGGSFYNRNEGKIAWNTSGTCAYGVYVKNTAAGSFNLCYSATRVDLSNAVFLCDGATITITTGFSNNPPGTVANIICPSSPPVLGTKLLSFSDSSHQSQFSRFTCEGDSFNITVTGPDGGYYYGLFDGLSSPLP